MIFLLAASSLSIWAQVGNEEYYSAAEMREAEGIVVPQYPGGEEALMKFLRKNVKYPREAVALKAEGRVVISFVVGVNGSLSDINASNCTLTSISKKKLKRLTLKEREEVREHMVKLFAQEGIRVVKEMKNWIPGYKINEATGEKTLINVKYNVPITFRFPR